MIDTLNMTLTADRVGGANLLYIVPKNLSNVSEHYNHSSGQETCSGFIGGLKVFVTPYEVKVGKGSFCKWCLGDNLQTLCRSDIKEGIERLSNALHVPMEEANVTRLDIAANIILKHPVEAYLSHLGAMPKKQRFEQPNSLYYKGGSIMVALYDKVKERANAGAAVPEIYNNRNVLRYEVRILQRLTKALNVPKATGGLLYDETFYINMVKLWRSYYTKIQKVNVIVMDWERVKTKRELYKVGLLELIEKNGGQVKAISQINEAAKMGDLTHKQAHDMREAIREACSTRAGFTKQSPLITELNVKINEVSRFFQ